MATTNRRGLIAAMYRTVNDEIQLLTVPSATEIDGVLRICNKSNITSKFSIAHCTAAYGNIAAADAHWLYFDKSINANSTIEISIHAGPLESIRVRAGSVDREADYAGDIKITFHLSGNTKVVS